MLLHSKATLKNKCMYTRKQLVTITELIISIHTHVKNHVSILSVYNWIHASMIFLSVFTFSCFCFCWVFSVILITVGIISPHINQFAFIGVELNTTNLNKRFLTPNTHISSFVPQCFSSFLLTLTITFLLYISFMIVFVLRANPPPPDSCMISIFVR